MSDQCLNCNHFNRPDMCIGVRCTIKESWYVLYLSQQIAALKERHNDVERITKEISDFLHPSGKGPESPSLCDVQAYIIHDIAAHNGENKRLREALEESVLQPETVQQMMREHDIIIDNHDDNMQKFAFTLYTVIANLADIANKALRGGEVRTNGKR